MMARFGSTLPSWRIAVVFALLPVAMNLWAADASVCFVCAKTFAPTVTIYTSMDSVTGEKVFVCGECVKTPDCHLCGVPSGNQAMLLPDGRHLCPRDSKTVVLGAAEIARVSGRMKEEADREFVRFMTFPDSIQIVIIDRLDAQSMYALDGRDVECPDILGWCRPDTNGPPQSYLIGLMSGLPLAELQSTYIHELTHTWVGQNLSPDRQRELMRGTVEGFCEMMAFLMMKKRGEERQQKVILNNLYTRGQVHLFIEAERRHGLNDILDWMRFGEATNLTTGHLDEIRKLKPVPPATVAIRQKPAIATNAAAGSTNSPPAPLPAPANRIRLDGILWSQNPVVIINGHPFRINESGKIKQGAQTIPIRCLAIRKNSARILRLDSGQEMLLQFPSN
jgi:hypothetical protein